MGQKIHPFGFRLGYITWPSAKWLPENGVSFAATLASDIAIRSYIEKYLPESAALSNVLIERTGRNVRLTLKTGKAPAIIGHKGDGARKLRADLSAKIGQPVDIRIEEIRKPELDATLVAQSIAQQLERRIMFRRAMKRALSTAIRLGAKGVKICVAGRLGGAEIARTEVCREGRVPLHTLRADIDYGTAIAKTTYGIIGVKVWIFKGEILSLKGVSDDAAA
jgi:small subunit ribosomal protein S3